MNVFAFASLTETQGLVLAEAMAAGVAVVAIDAPGAREIVRDWRQRAAAAGRRRSGVSARRSTGWSAEPPTRRGH